MRKFLFGLICLSLISSFFIKENVVKADEIDLNATSAVLMEPISKEVIYSKNPHEKLYPASMTKMMGLYLILEAVDNNKISFDDEVIVSSYASSMGGTQIFLEENEKMSLNDLFKSVAINSANDAIVAMGEYLASSNEKFVEMMNQKAQEFNMKDTHFVNATGFDDPNHYTSAYDMALLGSHLVEFDEKILKYTSMQEGYVRENTKEPFWLVNTNKLLKYYEGLDGLKTGYTKNAGYNLTATAKRNGVRLVSTVMHLDTIAHRSQDTIRLLDYGFSKLKAVSIFNKDDVVSSFVIDETLKKYLNVCVKQEVKLIIEKNENIDDIKIKAVLEKNLDKYDLGEEVGYLEIITPSNKIFKYKIYASNEVKGINFFMYLINIFKRLFA
ncbi:MAG: D-alanyl-D-alanine carboxypeptidase family protein [Bacilli bacterium]